MSMLNFKNHRLLEEIRDNTSKTVLEHNGELQVIAQDELLLIKNELADIKQTLADGTQKVQLSGNVVSKTVLSQALNAGPTVSTQIFTVTPPLGELWKIKNIVLDIPRPTGSTVGKHRFVIRAYGTHAFHNMLDVESNFGDPLAIKGNTLIGTSTKIPSTEIGQQNLMTTLVATVGMPFTFVYVNTTNAVQNNTMTLEIVKEVFNYA